MRVVFSRMFVALLLAGVSVSVLTAQETPEQEMGSKKKATKTLPDRIAPDQAKWYAHYVKQANAPNPDEQLLNETPEPSIKDGFVDLFNGTDLSGWTPRGGTCKFEVVGGVIEGTCMPGAKSTYLCTERNDYHDFIFTCEVKWEIDGNTGVMFRAKVKPSTKAKEDTDQTKVVYGPQVELEDFAKARFWSGAIYGQSCGGYFHPLWLKDHVKTRTAIKKDEWNRLTLSCKGKVVKTWINGVPMAHWVDEKNEYPTGYFGLQVHKGKQGKILFRNVKIKESTAAVEN